MISLVFDVSFKSTIQCVEGAKMKLIFTFLLADNAR
jgi:hypothetical protein